MDELTEKLGSILNNPQMMQQIMAMAQTMGQASAPKPEESQPAAPPFAPADAAALQRIMGLARQSGIDKNQQTLLKALNPYLSRERIGKLEKAMRAAKIAALASTALRAGGLNLFSGR